MKVKTCLYGKIIVFWNENSYTTGGIRDNERIIDIIADVVFMVMWLSHLY